MSEALTQWIVQTMNSLGYVGIALMMFLENIFPPIPSELIMPLAGFTVAKGELQFAPVILAGLVGSMLGTIPWYYAGKLLGEERLKSLADKYGKWLALSGKDIEKSKRWFNKHGTKAVFVGRLAPGIRSLISIPAGLTSMSFVPFLIYSTVGTFLWTLLLTSAGYFLGNNYELVDQYLAPVSKIVLATLVAAFVIWVVRRKAR